MSKANSEMTAKDVLEMVTLFADNQIEVFIDGGWGVDALVGEQTRAHADLDIALQHKDVPRLRALLEARGFSDVPRDDTRECNFVLGDERGRLVDIHSYTFDDAGSLVFGVAYPLDSLSGSGSIRGRMVKCISPEWMLKFHSGYRLDENDYQDVKALCRHFGYPIPEDYAEFVRNDPDA